jgi:hypothetical protein
LHLELASWLLLVRTRRCSTPALSLPIPSITQPRGLQPQSLVCAEGSRAARKRFIKSFAIIGAARLPSNAITLPLITTTPVSALLTEYVNV